MPFGFPPKRAFSFTGIPTIARPSLFTAIEEQLGLKLRPAKHMIDIWVVDHVERVAVEN
jgi:uncharacterized protein (TIGR03435 family)